MNLIQEREKQIYIITVVGLIINIFLVALKLIAGFVGHSHAMVADAAHSLSDLITDFIVLIFVKLSSRPSDGDHAYGHGKFETLATSIVGFVLLLVGLAIFWDGTKLVTAYFKGSTLYEPKMIAFWVALISIFLKEALYWWTYIKGRVIKSSVLMANAWHHRTDAFSSVAAAIGIGGAIFLGEKWRVLDPMMAIAVSLFIIYIAVKFIKSSIDELLEKSLPPKVQEEIMELIRAVHGVNDPHALKTRKIGSNIAIEVHLRFEPSMSVKAAHDIATEVEDKLKTRYGSETHVITHIETLKY
ncbi:MAG: cation diffusion facilitator family transporter [Campylobacteraceae bacterium]|nr:cation diffusion facilitator family transporter [Campylobacteraceae bacterium]